MNQKNKQYLTRILETGKVPHALVFAGGDFSKHQIMLDFASKLAASSVDIHYVKPEGGLGLHSMDSLRSFIHEVGLAPYGEGKKVFILEDAERMLATGANAVLKTLEEPAPTSIILLSVGRIEKLLPTIRSRVETLFFVPENIAKLKNPKLLNLLSNMPLAPISEVLEEVELLAADLTEGPEVEEAVEDKRFDHSAVQKAQQMKLGEGKLAVEGAVKIDQFLVQVLYWYRDLHILHTKSSREHLYYGEEVALLEKRRGRIPPPLEAIERFVERIRQMIERSGSVKNSLESLFLALKRIDC